MGAVATGVLMPGPKWAGYCLAPTGCGQAEIEDSCWLLQIFFFFGLCFM